MGEREMSQTADPWAIGTRITVDHPLHALVEAWQSIEDTLNEWNISDAEARAKAIVARLGALDPPVLTAHPHELKDEKDHVNRDDLALAFADVAGIQPAEMDGADWVFYWALADLAIARLS